MTRPLRRLAVLGAFAALLVAFLATHLPSPLVIGTSETDPGRHAVRASWRLLGRIGRALAPYWPDALDPLIDDKTAHVALFVGPGLLCGLAFGRRLNARKSVWILAALSVWGALDEVGQHLVGRDGEWGDWVADTMGAGLGLLLASAVVSALRRLVPGGGPSRATPHPPAPGPPGPA